MEIKNYREVKKGKERLETERECQTWEGVDLKGYKKGKQRLEKGRWCFGSEKYRCKEKETEFSCFGMRQKYAFIVTRINNNDFLDTVEKVRGHLYCHVIKKIFIRRVTLPADPDLAKLWESDRIPIRDIGAKKRRMISPLSWIFFYIAEFLLPVEHFWGWGNTWPLTQS